MSCRACCSASAAAAGFSTASPAADRLLLMSAHYPPDSRRNKPAPHANPAVRQWPGAFGPRPRQATSAAPLWRRRSQEMFESRTEGTT